jgi:hypothetical protein
MILLYMHRSTSGREKFLLQVIWERNIQNCSPLFFLLGSAWGFGITCFLKKYLFKNILKYFFYDINISKSSRIIKKILI